LTPAINNRSLYYKFTCNVLCGNGMFVFLCVIEITLSCLHVSDIYTAASLITTVFDIARAVTRALA